LPETDPYADLAEHGKRRFPSARSQKVIQSVFVYVPDTVDERLNGDGGFFIREGDVYVAIRPLAPGARWTTTKHPGFVRIELPGPVTGAAIEVGDRREYGSLENFRTRLAAARLDVSQLATAKAVEYVSSRGHRLRVAEVPGTWLPEASVNGVPLDFARWPITESPWLRCDDRVLDVNDGHAGLSIDWRGDLPVYTFYELREGKRVETGRRLIRDGRLVSEGM